MTRPPLPLVLLCAAALLVLSLPGSALGAGGCLGSALAGSFTEVPGSGAMGHAEFSLWLANRSSQTCTVTARPSLQLLGVGGKPLPTAQTAWQPAHPAAAVTLGPGGSAEATALVAIDIPGPGDTHRPGAPCQPTSTELRVGAAGGTSALVPIQPATAVCSSGSIALRPLVALTPVMPAGLIAMIKRLVRVPPREYTLKLRYDPEDSSWVEWQWGSAGPSDNIQGGIAFARLVGGRWRNVYGPGPTGFCPSAAVPRAVVRALVISCVTP